jgi:antitoxin Phd
MRVYTYSEARQKLSEVLEQAESTGKVLIRRKDGRTFALRPEKNISSPLDIPSVKAKITTQEIVDIIRKGREKGRTWRSTGRATPRRG